MAGVWGALGRLLATFGRIVLAFWAFKAISFKALVQDELQKAFWIDFGRIWHGFGEDFDRIWVGSWEDSASFLEGLWKDLEKILKKIVDGVRPFFRVFSQLGPPRCFASPREAPQCARPLAGRQAVRSPAPFRPVPSRQLCCFGLAHPAEATNISHM